MIEEDDLISQARLFLKNTICEGNGILRMEVMELEGVECWQIKCRNGASRVEIFTGIKSCRTELKFLKSKSSHVEWNGQDDLRRVP